MLPRNCFPVRLPDSLLTYTQTAEAKSAGAAALGHLPEWNLGDLYDAPESPALRADLEKARQDAEAMHERYAGKLEALLDGGAGGEAIAEAAIGKGLGAIGRIAGCSGERRLHATVRKFHGIGCNLGGKGRRGKTGDCRKNNQC